MRSILRYALTGVLLAGLPGVAAATESDLELWTSFWVTGPVKDKLLVSIDGSLRISDRGTSAPTVLIRPLVGVQVSKKLSLWTGYTYAASRPDNRPDVNEHRAVQQVLWSVGKVGKGSLTTRTRLETRWVDGREGTGWRVRQMARYTVPIDKAKTLLVLQTEPFFNLNSTKFGQAAGFDQIRNFVGLNLPVARSMSIDAGYMNRYIKRKGVEDRMDHIIPLTVVFRF